MVTKSVLQIDVKDNVMVALQNLKKGDLINKYNKEVILQNDITAKHKSFIRDMQPGDDVIMYGVLVGKAHEFIPVGGLMTKENITHAAGVFAYRSSQYVWVRPIYPGLQTKLSMDIKGLMAGWALPITGCLSPPFFAKTGTWMLYGKRFTMN